MKRLRRIITEEERAEYKEKRIEEKSKLTLAYQLGFYIGEQIVSRYLPTLSVDGLQTNKCISVTCGEGDESKRLNDIWFNKYHNTDGSGGESDEWEALRAYHEMLEAKYLPKTVECHFGVLNIGENDMVEFKSGISSSLWNCDCSHYSTKVEDISVMDDEDGWFTSIIIKR